MKKRNTLDKSQPPLFHFADTAPDQELEPWTSDGDALKQSVKATTGIDHGLAAGHLINRLVNLLPNGTSPTTANAAMALMGTMAPRDSYEALLVAQMIAVHEFSMTYARKALREGLSMEQAGYYLNQAQKLMRTYATHLDTLMRYRNQGKQTIQVNHQHVTVSDGGQAIVGNAQQVGGGVTPKNVG